MKNGDEIKAKVTEVNLGEIKYKKWDNKDGPTYSLPKKDAFIIQYENGTKEVFNETIEVETKEESKTAKKEYKHKGFSNITEVQYSKLFGLHSERENYVSNTKNTFENPGYTFGIQNTFSYQFIKGLKTGLGLGFDYDSKGILGWSGYNKDSYVIPFYVNIRYDVLNKQISPFAEMSIGYSLIAYHPPFDGGYYTCSYKGGLLLNPTIGVLIYISKNIAYNFSIGYKQQSHVVTYEFSQQWGAYPDIVYHNYLKLFNVKTGISF